MGIGILTGEVEEILLNLLPINQFLSEVQGFAIIDFWGCKFHQQKKWCRISVKGRCNYDTESLWANYLSYTHAIMEYSWVGILNDIPSAINLGTLSKWERYQTTYRQETDKDDTDFG